MSLKLKDSLREKEAKNIMSRYVNVKGCVVYPLHRCSQGTGSTLAVWIIWQYYIRHLLCVVLLENIGYHLIYHTESSHNRAAPYLMIRFSYYLMCMCFKLPARKQKTTHKQVKTTYSKDLGVSTLSVETTHIHTSSHKNATKPFP